MRRTRFDDWSCSIARTLDVIGERWTLLVIREAFLGVRRFDEMAAHLGIARNVLTDRLRTLVDAGILERRQYSEHPPRDEYRLTEMGLDLYPVVVSLVHFGDRWLADGGPPLELVHRACGHVVVPELICPDCRVEIDARSMTARPGPGASPDTYDGYAHLTGV